MEPTADAKPEERLIGTATHVCQLLQAFSLERPTLSLGELTSHLGLRKSSVHRLARTLLVHHVLAVDPLTKRYRLGAAIGMCAQIYAATESAASLAAPFLERLRTVTGETVTLQVRAGDKRRVVTQLEGVHSLRVVIDERVEYSLTDGAAGHALRAFESAWRDNADRAILAKVRRQGYAVSSGELLPGITSIAMVVSAKPEPRFVVGVNGPNDRVVKQKALIVRELTSVTNALARVLTPSLSAR